MTSSRGEAACRDVILGRTGPVCEGCRTGLWTDKAHRVARSQGGAWEPANILGLCRACHAWAHAHPVSAGVAGWALTSGTDPTTAAVLLASTTLTPGWYLLDSDGTAHPDGPAGLPAGYETFLPPHFPGRFL